MKVPAELLVSQFFRSYTEPFTAKDFAEYLSRCGIKSTLKECEEYLDSQENVFTLAGGMYATRACAFTNQYFSIKPTRKELEKGVFIVGDRCIPFVDSQILSFAITFVYKKQNLPKKVVEYDSPSLLEMFSLYGDEYAPQYIAQDTANEGMDLASLDYTLPPVVKVTAVDMTEMIKDGFTVGDRLICRVTDWDTCIVEVDFVHRTDERYQMTMDDVSREQWYKLLEKYLLESFEVMGPVSSIEEQLALIFADKRTELCTKDCGSIEEFFHKTNKVGFELFGVETRLWFKNQDVPAVGSWNDLLKDDDKKPETEETSSFKKQFEKPDEFPDYVIDAFIKDQLFEQILDFEVLMKKLYPNAYRLSVYQQKVMLLHLKNRHAILSQSYNRFADSEIGDLRHKVLELFSQVNKLVFSIDLANTDLTVYPQQALVILSQIFAHILHIVEVSETDASSIVRDLDELYLSVEGMELNFECVSEELKSVLSKESKNGFTVI